MPKAQDNANEMKTTLNMQIPVWMKRDLISKATHAGQSLTDIVLDALYSKYYPDKKKNDGKKEDGKKNNSKK